MVCTIEGVTITTEIDQDLKTGPLTNQDIINPKIIKLSENQIFIIGYDGAYCRCAVYIIGESSITLKTYRQLLSIYGSKYGTNVISLSENKIFIISNYSSVDYYLYGIVCTINEEIEVSSEIKLSSLEKSGLYAKMTMLLDGRIFIAYKDEENNVRGMICSIKDDVVTIEIDTILFSSTNLIKELFSLSDNRVFLIFEDLKGIIYNINNTTITKILESQLVENYNITGNLYPASSISFLEKENKMLIVYYQKDDDSLYYNIYNIDKTITLLESNKLLLEQIKGGSIIETVVLDNFFIIYDEYIFLEEDYWYFLYGTALPYEQKITSLTGTIFGIANQNGEEGDTIEVFVPNSDYIKSLPILFNPAGEEQITLNYEAINHLGEKVTGTGLEISKVVYKCNAFSGLSVPVGLNTNTTYYPTGDEWIDNAVYVCITNPGVIAFYKAGGSFNSTKFTTYNNTETSITWSGNIYFYKIPY